MTRRSPAQTKLELELARAQERSLRRAIQVAVRHVLWRRGVLTWKLHPGQKAVLALMLAAFASGAARYVMEIARRWGKSRLLCVLAVETCIRKPKARVVYGAPTLKDLQEFVIPHIEAITEDAPEGLRWRFNAQRMHYECENGAYIHLFGCDDKRKANRGRGPGADLVILDECGFIAILRYVIRSVVRPQLLHSAGKLLLASTPAEEPDHDFTAVAEVAERNGHYARRTVFENPLLSPERIAGFIAEDAQAEGMTEEEFQRSDDFRREYMAERVINKLLVVMGNDWAEKRAKCIGTLPRPEFFDAMTTLDPGGNDPHALHFGYWHFEARKYVVERELLLKNGENTEDVAALIRRTEKELWGVSLFNGTLRAVAEDPEGPIADKVPEWMQDMLARDAQPQPYLRVMDVNVALAKDLYSLHQLAFLNTEKPDKQGHVNAFRVMVRREEFLLHPDCKETDRQLAETTWKDTKRREYARKGGHHGDLLDCAVYANRNINRDKNPVPKDWSVPAYSNPIEARLAHEAQQRKAEAIMGNSPLARRLLRRAR